MATSEKCCYMTQKDIRDIAAYWGAPISYTIQAGNDPWEENRANGSTRYGKEEFQGIVSITAMDGIYLWWTAQRVTDVKLHLRQIQSLTDDEVRMCSKLYDIERDGYKVSRNVNGVWIGEWFSLGNNCEVMIDNDTERWTTEIETDKIASVHAYLQSIGVYVPGSIDPQYIELLP